MTRIFYPRGSGGSWLNNLIWHLESADFDLPRATVVFDNEPMSSVKFFHAFEIPDPNNPQQVLVTKHKRPGDVLFSCDCVYNHYLNNAVKVKLHIHQLDQQPWLQQFFALSNGARYYFSDAHYRDQYCCNIDLDYSTIFCNPQQFVTDLFDLLNKMNLRYTANEQYVFDSIAYYRSTCPDPGLHFGNFDSQLWLASCHAVTLIDGLGLDGTVTDKESAQQLLRPHADHCANRIRPMMFEWKQ